MVGQGQETIEIYKGSIIANYTYKDDIVIAPDTNSTHNLGANFDGEGIYFFSDKDNWLSFSNKKELISIGVNGTISAANINVTATQLSYLAGATSNIQAQIGALTSLGTAAKGNLVAAINELNSNIDELKWFKYFDGSKALDAQDPWNTNYGFSSFDVIMMSVYLPGNRYETFFFFTYATDTSHIIPIATSNNELGYIGFKTNGRFLENPKAMLLSGSAWKDITANVVVGSIKAGRMWSTNNVYLDG